MSPVRLAIGVRLVTLLALLVAFFPGAVRAQEPQLETLSSLPEEPLPDSLQKVLSSDGYRVTRNGEVLAELWLRDELPEGAMVPGALGVEFGGWPVGELIGLVRFPGGWTDYRDTEIAPGLYTLRYGTQPADGDHMGVSLYRDFLLLLPAAEDETGRSFDQESLNEASQAASEKVHPAVLALFPIWEEVTEPNLVRNEVDQWTLAFSYGDRAMGLVLEGHGEIQ